MSQQTHFPTVLLAELTSRGINPQTNPSKPVVLVVDDEPVIADTLAVILGQNGFMAMAAYDGRTALEIADLVAPDLLLSDVVMPGMSGVDLAIAIRQAQPNCRILLFSGTAANVDLLNAAGEAGRDLTVLSKPLHPKDLLARVSETLDSRAKTERAVIEASGTLSVSA